MSWSSDNTYVTEEGGLRLKSRVGQTGHSEANGSLLLRYFFEKSFVALRRIDAEMDPANLLGLHAWHNTAQREY